jgi:glycosyltransferase involved in cell wall biosynthesis
MQEQKKPLVSISIPTYNSAATIENTIQSILKQTYDNLEINVLDDCSKDNTVELVESIRDDRIKMYRNERNLGMVGNWNRCLEVAAGEFVKIVCADDLLDETAIEKEVAAMIASPGANLVESDTRLVDINGKKTGSFPRYRKSGIVAGKEVAKTSIIWNNFFGAPVNNLIRKNILDKVGGFDPNFTYILDFEMWMRIACEGDIFIIHEQLNSFTVRNDSNTGNLIGKNRGVYVEEHRRLVEKYKDRLGLSNFQCRFSVWFRKFRNVVIGLFLKMRAK